MPQFPFAPLTSEQVAAQLEAVLAGTTDPEQVFQRLRGCGALFHYECKPQTADPRDRKLPKLQAPVVKASIAQYVTRIENQGQFGSCTGQSGTSALELVFNKEGRFPGELSRMFCYDMSRLLEGTLDKDDGATLRDTCKVLNKYGAPLESLWAYRAKNLHREPDDKTKANALLHKLHAYYAIERGDVQALRAALSSGYPVLFAMDVFQDFESITVSRTGQVPLPHSDEESLGGHAVYAVAYDDEVPGGDILCPNSWGKGWGDHGKFHLKYDYFERYTWDAWVLTEADLEAAE